MTATRLAASNFLKVLVVALGFAFAVGLPAKGYSNIVITSGQIVTTLRAVDHEVSSAFDLVGDSRGFSIAGDGRDPTIFFFGTDPAPVIAPGATISSPYLRMALGSPTFESFRLDGTHYQVRSPLPGLVPGPLGNASLTFGPTESMIAPALSKGDMTISAPFTLSGSVEGPFGGSPPPTEHFHETFSGAGTVFVDLKTSPDGAGWDWIDTRYIASTPEPSAEFLLGLGFAGLGAMAWRQGPN